MTMRALTMLNEAGDTTISWTEDRDDEVEAIIQKRMDEGCAFFIIEDRGLRRPLRDAADARAHRVLAIPDADFAKFVGEGRGEAIPTPPEKVKTVRKAKTAKEVAGAQSVGVKPMRGG
jgi:hypothetical protein